MTGPGENPFFETEDMQPGDKSPEFNPFADLKKFNKPSGHKGESHEKPETDEEGEDTKKPGEKESEEKVDLGISDKDFFGQKPDKKPELKPFQLSKNTEKKSQKAEGAEQEESRFQRMFTQIAAFITQIIEGLKSMGSDVLTHLANFFNSNFFRGLAQAARETEQAPIIREKMVQFRKTVRNTFVTHAIPHVSLQETPDTDPSWQQLFDTFQAIKKSNPLLPYPEPQFLKEAVTHIRVARKLSEIEPMTITIQELVIAAQRILTNNREQVADAEMNVMEFSGQLHDVIERTDFKHIIAQEGDYTDLLTQYKIAKRNHRNLTVKEFVSAILNQPSIKAKRPQDVTIEDFRREAPIVVRERFSSAVTVKVTTPPHGNDTAKTNLPEKPQGKEA